MQVEKIDRYVTFEAAYQHFAQMYVDHKDIKALVDARIRETRDAYEQVLQQLYGDGGSGGSGGMFDYALMRRKRDVDACIQQHTVYTQRAMLQLMSMGLELKEVEEKYDASDATQKLSQDALRSAFNKKPSDGHTPPPPLNSTKRKVAVVYDSDDEHAADRMWKARRKVFETELDTFVADEQKAANPKPYQKLHSKFADEFVRKFCGHYGYESRAVLWKRVWHCYTDDKDAEEQWPMDHFLRGMDGTLAISVVKDGARAFNTHVEIGSVPGIAQVCGSGGADTAEADAKLFDGNQVKREFYRRSMCRVPRLPENLSNVVLPTFVWKLGKKELENKYGTYMFANWKQSSDGKVTTNRLEQERFPVATCQSEIDKRRWYSEQKWYVYRLRYWKKLKHFDHGKQEKKRKDSNDILDFLEDDDDDDDADDDEDGAVDKQALKEELKGNVNWWGSNDVAGYALHEDRLCIQNDHCYGAPTLFLWTDDFTKNDGADTPLKMRYYRAKEGIGSRDGAGIVKLPSRFNLDAPIVPTNLPAQDGPIRSGTKLPIGAREHTEVYRAAQDPFLSLSAAADVSGDDALYAMDVYVPPVFNLSVFDDIDTLYYNWNRVNHDAEPDHAASKSLVFENKSAFYDRLIEEKNNILFSTFNVRKWTDFNNHPQFHKNDDNKYPSVLSHAFFFHNFLTRTFRAGRKSVAKIKYPRNWVKGAVFADDADEFTFSFGFTHPRPIAPETCATLLYKKDAFEVYLRSDGQEDATVTDDDVKFTDWAPKNDAYDLDVSMAKYKWTSERLEVFLTVRVEGSSKLIRRRLFSEIVRDQQQFMHLDAYHDQVKKKKYVFAENDFNSHVVMVSKFHDGRVLCYLDGECVADVTLQKLCNQQGPFYTHLTNLKMMQRLRTESEAYDEPDEDEIFLAHTPGQKSGTQKDLFHGYMYGISLHAVALQPYELNTMYRQLRTHRDLHVVSLCFRNKHELIHETYPQFL